MLYVAESDPHGPGAHILRTTEGIYMCCASQRCDDANQWRLYAGGGRGYAIEIDPLIPLTTALDESPERGSEPSDSFSRELAEAFESVSVSPWLKVLYTAEEKEAALTKLLSDAQEERDHISENAADADDYQEQSDIADAEMLGHLAQLAQLMKSEGFAGENEYRVIVSDWFERHQNFRDTPHGIVRYARLTHNRQEPHTHRIAYLNEGKSDLTLPIRSVWLGPLLHTLNNHATVEALLKHSGFEDCRIETSKVPLGH